MQHWFTYPNIDPVAFHLGPIAVRYYGLSYLIGFVCVGLWMNRPAGRKRLGLSSDQILDFLVYALGGVLIGGRSFFILADILSHHNASFYFGSPRNWINLIAVWNGGMGFFGGLIGVIIALALFLRKHPGLKFNVLADEVVVMLPVGIALTRVVNFINDELVGNICNPDRAWCMQFPHNEGFRYPSQIFEALLDIAVLPILLLLYRRKPPDGVVAWTWFTLYGVTRSLSELWRQTDIALGPFTGGQLLALPMIVIGIALVVRSYRGGQRTEASPAT